MRLQSIFLNLILALALTASVLMSPTLVQAAEPPLVLKPSSKWEVNYKDDSCRLARRFGEGDDTVVVMFDRYKPTIHFWLTLVGKPLEMKGESRPLNVQFGPTESKQKMQFFTGTLDEETPAIFIINYEFLVPENEDIWKTYAKADLRERKEIEVQLKIRQEAISSISLHKPLRRKIVLETGPLGPAISALEKCTDELLTHWGIDIEKHANLKRAATPIYPREGWLTSSDYPSAMLEKGARSVVHFRLNVDENGMPTACHIQHSNRLKEFDDLVCKLLLKRARFDPALADDGTPIASYHADAVLFIL